MIELKARSLQLSHTRYAEAIGVWDKSEIAKQDEEQKGTRRPLATSYHPIQLFVSMILAIVHLRLLLLK
ncbi:hypothetical protein H6F89_33320 [Cyanobacteria bacterium FACHB-63]|nr:hypothetical protein [Cyanobacteria bacterium FACHB-63]